MSIEISPRLVYEIVITFSLAVSLYFNIRFFLFKQKLSLVSSGNGNQQVANGGSITNINLKADSDEEKLQLTEQAKRLMRELYGTEHCSMIVITRDRAGFHMQKKLAVNNNYESVSIENWTMPI